MSRFSGPGHEVEDAIAKVFPADRLRRPVGPRAWVRWLKRDQAFERNAVTPPEKRRSTREEAAGRKLVKGRWV